MMPNTVQIAVDILIALLTGGILLFFLEIMHLEGSVSRDFKEVMNPFYHKLSKYLVFLNYYSFSLTANKDDTQAQKFRKQVEALSRKGLEAVMSGRDISYLSAADLDTLCEEINHIWYVLDRGGQLMHNLQIDSHISTEEAQEALSELFPKFKGKPLEVALLYEISGRFYNKVWEPVQHCTNNYEYFQEEEAKARKLILSSLVLTLLSLIAIMIWVDVMPVIIPCLLAVISSVVLFFCLKQLSFVSSISKRLIRSTRDEIEENHKSIKDMWKKIARYFEIVGLALLLGAFGWQCWEEHSNQMKLEGYVYELNEKMLNVWEGVYDEAVHSDRYHGKATVAVNYDALNTQMKDWQQIKNDFSTLDRQTAFFFWCRFVMYALGSLLIIVAKWPKKVERE